MNTDVKCYCLTLPQTPWRWEAAQERFQAAGIVAEPFHGVHGATFALVPRLAAHDEATAKMPEGAVGVWLSYLLLLTTVRERPSDVVLVFEDDVVLCPNFAEELQHAIAELPDDWDVVSVGSCCTAGLPSRRISRRVSRVEYPLCLHATLWRRRVVPRVLELLTRAACNDPLDVALQRDVYPQVAHYTLTPPLASQDSYDGRWGSLVVGSAFTWRDIPGWFDFDRVYLEAVDRCAGRTFTDPAVLVEVGCWLGRSTAFIAEELKRRRMRSRLYAVDTWKGSAGLAHMLAVARDHGGDLFSAWQRNMVRAGVADWVTPLRMPSVEAATTFTDNSVDFVFIDADHGFDAVVADIRAWRPKLRRDCGVMAGHDADMPQVMRAVRQEYGDAARVWQRTWIVDGGT